MVKQKQRSLLPKKVRFTNTEVIELVSKYGLKGTYKQLYDALRHIRALEALGFTVTKK